MAGGILFNFIFAFFALTGLYYFGMPKTPILYPLYASTQLSSVEKESPDTNCGPPNWRSITQINDIPMHEAQEITTFVRAHHGQQVTITFNCAGTLETKTVGIASRSTGDKITGFLGVDFVMPKFSTIESIAHGFSATLYLSNQVIGAFKGIFLRGELQKMSADQSQ